MCSSSQIRGVRTALGPDLGASRTLSLPSLPSRTQGLVRPGPMEPDTNKRQPCQIGLALAAWGNGPLISLVILPGCPVYP